MTGGTFAVVIDSRHQSCFNLNVESDQNVESKIAQNRGAINHLGLPAHNTSSNETRDEPDSQAPDAYTQMSPPLLGQYLHYSLWPRGVSVCIRCTLSYSAVSDRGKPVVLENRG